MSIQEHDPLDSIDTLVTYYQNLNRENNLYIGIELERSGVYRDTLQPVSFGGESGYQAMFQKLIEELGWEILEQEGENIIELCRGDTRITIEADGRPELSGSPKEHLHDLSREFRLHDNELREIGNVFNIAWLTTGMQPISPGSVIPMIDKERYTIFQKYCPNKEGMAAFLLRNNGLTANFSFTSEENAIQKAQTAFRVLPIVGAMFASSPFSAGQPTPYLDMRRYYHTGFWPQRTGIPSSILDEDFSFRHWIEYYLDLPVIIVKTKDGGDFHPDSLSFRDWMTNGYDGRRPSPYDFDQHIKTVWSDLRLRTSYLEYRVADSVPSEYAMSLPALMKGLIFDSENWEEVRNLTESWTYEDVIRIDREAWKTGLQTKVQGKTLLSYAQELLTMANEKLHSFERTDNTDTDEAVYLTPLKEQIYIKEQSFAEELLALWEKEWNGDISRIIQWCEFDNSNH